MTSYIEDFNPLEGKRLEILNQNGELDTALRPKDFTDKDVTAVYEAMVLTRAADKKALSLQRQGRMGTFAPIIGQEASNVASTYALSPSDWIVQAFREQGSYVVRNVPLKNFFLFYMGNERGSVMPEKSHLLPISIPVGSQTLHGAGIGFAMKLKREKSCVLTYFGDGATSEGDFHEAMNFAGTKKAHTVFFCQNNQWAISVPRSKQTEAKTLAQKAIAYGFSGVQVDGNDIFAVFAATKEAAEKARRGDGPTLIESYTYRMSDHTTADDARKYRDPKEVEAWLPKDPIRRVRLYLEKQKLWNDKKEEALLKKVSEEVERQVAEAEATPVQQVDDIFDYTYAELPPRLEEQKEYLKQFFGN